MGIISKAAGATGNIGCEILADGAELIAQLVEGWKWVRETEVLVGIPKGSSEGGSGNDLQRGLDNVSLMYLHTNGSPVNRIPPRPTIEPAIAEQETNERIKEYLSQGIDAAIRTGDTRTAENCYRKAGMCGATAAQEKFGTGAPNAPITINGGWMRNHVSGKPVHVKGKGSSAPLIDTGSLRKSVTFVVRRNGKDI